jgi:hypothetical protein
MTQEKQPMTLQELASIFDDVTYKDYMFHAMQTSEHFEVKATFIGGDLTKPSLTPTLQHTRKWVVSRFASRSEVVQTLFKLVVTSEEHEAREAFRYRGKAIFGPHFSVDTLHQICGKAENYDYRDPAVVNALVTS